jgi:uncharacterized membrane protein YdjX (TVP38/TMEM64 family)
MLGSLVASPSKENHRDPLLRPAFKALVLLLVLLACVVGVYLTPLRDDLGRIRELSAGIQRLGFWSPLAFVLVVAALVAAGCPRLLLCPIGGLAFGFVQGLLWSQIGSLIGSYGTFLFVRWGGQEWVQERYPQLARLSRALESTGFSTVLFLRLTPIAGFVVNLFLGLLRVKHKDFLLGTLVGTIPQAVPATLMGSSALGVSLLETSGSLSMGILGLIVAWVLCGTYARYSKTQAAQDVRTNFRHAFKK